MASDYGTPPLKLLLVCNLNLPLSNSHTRHTIVAEPIELCHTYDNRPSLGPCGMKTLSSPTHQRTRKGCPQRLSPMPR